MSRPRKTGLDYFPLDVDFLEDDKIALIEAEFGSNGVMVMIRLLCKIYRDGFYSLWNEDSSMLMARRLDVGVSPEIVQLVVDRLLERDFFDHDSYEQRGVLTSVAIQKRFFEAVASRRSVIIEDASLLLIDPEEYKNIEFASIKLPLDGNKIESNYPKNGINAIKKSKEKKSKEENTKTHSKENAGVSESSSTPPVDFTTQCQQWRQELLRDEEWLASAVRQSGMGISFRVMLPDKMLEFQDFIIASGEQASLRSRKDYTRRFHFWWTYHGRKAQQTTAAAGGVRLQATSSSPPVSRTEQMMNTAQRASQIALQLIKQSE